MTQQHDDKPWYKQFWPWVLIALPATSVIASLTMVTIAVQNQDTVVRDDWYKDGKAINESLERDEKAKTLRLKGSLSVDSLTGEVSVTLAGQAPLTVDSLHLVFSHPTLVQRDQALTLKRQPDGRFHGLLDKPLEGRYYIELSAQDWRIQDMQTFPQGTISLGQP